eukprot:TRINITY_DN3207_c0_g1_i1.p1 TRINITY_DN3207_c0_g1~~TRINITY_DN3207_c0_g1_i1.p1  ORF type:complete len:271 (-),score=46.83 TRINITY_DN3207_c0_g1_i1:219-1031(-)
MLTIPYLHEIGLCTAASSFAAGSEAVGKSTAPPDAPARPIEDVNRIYILAGQSNMVGRADPSGVPLDPSVQITWNNDGNFGEPSTSPWTSLQPQQSVHGLHVGPEASLQVPPRAHFIKFGMGSTKLGDHWHPETGEHYQRFLSFVRQAIDAVPMPSRLCGFFWLQGESDTGAAKTANAYQQNLIQFVKRFRNDLGAPDLPFIASQVVWKGKKLDVVNQAICAACDELQPAAWTSADGLTVADDDHLDTKSVLEVGDRMSRAYAALVAPAS